MIYVFSGTGNSKHVAEQLANKTGEKLFSINENMKAGGHPALEADERVIIVSPTYAWRIPKVVEDWVRQTVFPGAKQIWFVMTCGGEIGNAEEFNKSLAADKRLEYMGTMGIMMPDNYIIMFKDISQAKAEEIYSKTFVKIDTAANQIKAGRQFLVNNAGLADKIKSGPVNIAFNKMLKADSYEASDACTSCGSCAKICPLNNIKLVSGKPEWGAYCTHCMACISYCPVQAIEYGSKTVGKRKYTFESYFSGDGPKRS